MKKPVISEKGIIGRCRGATEVFEFYGWLVNNKYCITEDGMVFGWDSENKHIDKERCYFPKYIVNLRNRLVKENSK